MARRKKNNYRKSQTRVRSYTKRYRLRSPIFNNQYQDYNARFVESRRLKKTYTPKPRVFKTQTTSFSTISPQKRTKVRPLLYSPLGS